MDGLHGHCPSSSRVKTRPTWSVVRGGAPAVLRQTGGSSHFQVLLSGAAQQGLYVLDWHGGGCCQERLCKKRIGNTSTCICIRSQPFVALFVRARVSQNPHYRFQEDPRLHFGETLHLFSSSAADFQPGSLSAQENTIGACWNNEVPTG